MHDRAVSLQPHAALRIEQRPLDLTTPLERSVLAAVTFGDAVANHDPRFIRVGLPLLGGQPVMELWHGSGTVHTGRSGDIRYAADANYLFGVLELDERAHGGIRGAAQSAYGALRSFLATCAQPHLLRVWNYFDAINEGVGDDERYKQFCIGRAAGLGAWPADRYPAATVIGRRDGDPRLQIFWLSAATPGTPIDNPRQTRPNRYPREYGPRAPQFSRAMRVAEQLVLISGTASIVGHDSHHRDDLGSQLHELLHNLGSVLHKALGARPGLPAQFGPHTSLRFYLREPAQFGPLQAALRERLPVHTSRIILAGEVCRADLLLEADGVHVP